MILVSAQDICRTAPWCKASNCPDDAEPSGYCRRHQEHLAAGKAVAVHVVEQPTDASTHLRCSVCKQHKTDDEFHRQTTATHRRQRNAECRECANKRRRDNRKGPSGDAVRQREREAKRRYVERVNRVETPEERSLRLYGKAPA